MHTIILFTVFLSFAYSQDIRIKMDDDIQKQRKDRIYNLKEKISGKVKLLYIDNNYSMFLLQKNNDVIRVIPSNDNLGFNVDKFRLSSNSIPQNLNDFKNIFDSFDSELIQKIRNGFYKPGQQKIKSFVKNNIHFSDILVYQTDTINFIH